MGEHSKAQPRGTAMGYENGPGRPHLLEMLPKGPIRIGTKPSEGRGESMLSLRRPVAFKDSDGFPKKNRLQGQVLSLSSSVFPRAFPQVCCLHHVKVGSH